MPDVFDKIANWLTDRALEGADLEETVEQLIDRLIKLGIPLSRFVIGRTILHPVIGAYDLTWTARSNRITVTTIPRDRIVEISTGAPTPFARLALGHDKHMRADLTNPKHVERFAVFARLAAEGATDYAAWGHLVREAVDYSDSEYPVGAALSICTNRVTGFSATEIANIEKLIKPLFIHVRMSTEMYLAQVLLETYLGRGAGKKVLDGQSARGMGETINCVLFFSDMRGSTRLSQELAQDDYLAAVNQYFDCVAGAVQDHGGEVLKFVGDGVLAIFPIDADLRPVEAMCTAALSSARDAYARAAKCQNGPSFGVALHVGEVVYGNVGTSDRLDYTATGLAVAVACRCEALTRTLETHIIGTSDFTKSCTQPATPLGTHTLRGLDDTVDLSGYGLT
ncbi:adenylate/guanylate cyclase domain-containing protein [Tateyamaria omphalii]|nr:adenylate/guanylate cyclase domain-containing protein [Tateyamaria omphalii]